MDGSDMAFDYKAVAAGIARSEGMGALLPVVEKELLPWVLTHHLQYFRISIRTCSIILNSYLHKLRIHRLMQSVRKW